MSHLQCQICACALAKSDAQFIDEESFALMAAPPAQVPAGAYCNTCFEERARPELDAYEALVEKARNVNLFYLSQSRESRFVRRT